MKTPAERQQALRDARKAEGLSLLRVWVAKPLHATIKAYAAMQQQRLNRAKRKKEQCHE